MKGKRNMLGHYFPRRTWKETKTMQPRTIMMPYGGLESEAAALETAFRLVAEYQAHIDVWTIAPDPFTMLLPYEAIGGDMVAIPQEIIDGLKEKNAAAGRDARKKYLDASARFVVRDIDTPPVMGAASSTFHNATGNIGETLGVRGRLSDLIVMSRISRKEDSRAGEAIHGALFQSARPVLLVPPGVTAKEPSNNILIAWNGSAEAARAVAFALPYLKGKNVRIITQQVKGGSEPPLLPSDLAHYLKRHGIEATSGVCWNKDMTLPDCIIDAARYDKSDMIVMGAYSHSRVKEIILGGVTDYMLGNAEFPVFMVR